MIFDRLLSVGIRWDGLLNGSNLSLLVNRITLTKNLILIILQTFRWLVEILIVRFIEFKFLGSALNLLLSKLVGLLRIIRGLIILSFDNVTFGIVLLIIYLNRLLK